MESTMISTINTKITDTITIIPSGSVRRKPKRSFSLSPATTLSESESKILVSCTNDRNARKYTASPHPAGSGFDYITALHVKSEWERSLGLALSGSDENIYEAGSPESQGRVYDGMDKMGVWIDTVCPLILAMVYELIAVLPGHEHSGIFFCYPSVRPTRQGEIKGGYRERRSGLGISG
jgi:hypothetical protein